jgi:hypothetical protein
VPRQLNPKQTLEIDLVLPEEVWELPKIDDEGAAILRMVFYAGYTHAYEEVETGTAYALRDRVGEV